jgi:hypothetical protein
MSFLVRLWRGEVSLQTTYWIFGALVVFMFEVFEMAAGSQMAAGSGEETGHTIAYYISTVYYLFIGIAILRSSFRTKTGSRMFVTFAQMTAFGLLGTVVWRIFAGALFG